MSDYSLANLQEIDNMSTNDAVEAHFARKYLYSRDLGVSLFKYRPNYRSQMAHSHKIQEEAYVVVSGAGRVLLNNTVVELKKWDVLRVAPEILRAFESGPEGLSLIAIGGPKPNDGDGVKQEPNWPA